jgi:N-methylhydantoinase A
VTLRLTARTTINRPETNYSLTDESQTAQKLKGHRRVHFPDAGFVDCPVYERAALSPGEHLHGPAIVEQMDTTTVIFPDQAVECDPFGNLIVSFD